MATENKTYCITKPAWRLIVDRLRDFERRATHHLPRPEITTKMLLDAFVKPEHHELAQTIGQLFELETSNVSICRDWSDDGAYISINIQRPLGPPVPRYVDRNRNQEDYIRGMDQHELIRAITPYVDQRVLTHYNVTSSWAMLRHLDAICTSMQHVRFYFPGIVQLVGGPGGDQCMVRRLATASVPKTMVELPAGFRDLSHDLTAWITAMALLPPVAGVDTTPTISVDVDFDDQIEKYALPGVHYNINHDIFSPR